jgi:hypothetical protein
MGPKFRPLNPETSPLPGPFPHFVAERETNDLGRTLENSQAVCPAIDEAA